MKDLACIVLVEEADAGHLRVGVLCVVVIDLALGDFFRCESDTKVTVEVAAI